MGQDFKKGLGKTMRIGCGRGVVKRGTVGEERIKICEMQPVTS